MTDVTQILSQIEDGDPSAAEQLLPLVYDELRQLAAVKLANEKLGQTLQATARVHEAYLRLVGRRQREPAWDSRAHFLSTAATAMRRILIERVRYRQSLIHGGGRRREELATDHLAAPEPDGKLLALDAALQKLTESDPDKARLVELRDFAGLTGDQAGVGTQLVPGRGQAVLRHRRGFPQQAKTDHQKIVRLPYPRSLRNGSVSQPGSTPSARIHPRIPLKRQIKGEAS